jgi:hypothetical protein
MAQSHDEPTDDFDMRGELTMSATCTAATLSDVGSLYATMATIRDCSEHGDYTCPHSDARLRVTGATDDCGDVLVQIFRGSRKCDAVPAIRLRAMRPEDYSRDPVAAKSVAWMRDVGRAIVAHRSAIMASLQSSAMTARDATWSAITAADSATIS